MVNESQVAETPFIHKKYFVAFVCVTSLFFMWAIANNFNDILIKQFQKALDLTRMQSGLVQTAFYFGYFIMALPAGIAMKRVGYKIGILVGLSLYAIGAVLFYPAAEVQSFAFFLAALFVIASGLTFLETAANPYITVMGDPRFAAQRLNLAQSFNGLGAFLAPFIGGVLIFSGVEYSENELALLSPAEITAYRTTEALAVQIPYLGLAAIVAILAVLIYLAPFPRVELTGSEIGLSSKAMCALWKVNHWRNAVIAQFFYVGAQVGIWSYFINFAQDVSGATEKAAANYLGVSLILFMVGRFSGTLAMGFIDPARLMSVYALVNVVLCVFASFVNGYAAVLVLGTTSFFMSIMFPTIFALGLKGLGGYTKIGSSLIVMAIIGGAIFPPLMGLVADITKSIQISMLIPAICFSVVLGFGRHAEMSE